MIGLRGSKSFVPELPATRPSVLAPGVFHASFSSGILSDPPAAPPVGAPPGSLPPLLPIGVFEPPAAHLIFGISNPRLDRQPPVSIVLSPQRGSHQHLVVALPIRLVRDRLNARLLRHVEL